MKSKALVFDEKGRPLVSFDEYSRLLDRKYATMIGPGIIAVGDREYRLSKQAIAHIEGIFEEALKRILRPSSHSRQ